MTHPLLIDVPPAMLFKGPGNRRSHIGNTVEDLVCRIMGWERQRIDGRKEFCPDALTETRKPVEIKSLRVSSNLKGKAVIYDWRMTKEAAHAPDLTYAFFCRRGGKVKSHLEDLLDSIVEHPPILLIAPASEVHKAARQCPVRIPKWTPDMPKRRGYTRAGYIEGYRNLPIERLLSGVGRWTTVVTEVWDREFTVNVCHSSRQHFSQ